MDRNMANIRRQVVENSEELQDFLRDLNNWEKDIKRKDEELRTSPSEPKNFPPIRKPIQKPKPKGSDSNKEGTDQAQDVGGKQTILGAPDGRPKESKVTSQDNFPTEKSDQEKSTKETETENRQTNDTEITKLEEVQKSSSEDEEDDEDEELNEIQQKQKALFEKDRGNRFFSEGKYDDAIACYTSGIMADPANAVLPANRAMALIKKGQLAAAEQDCALSISVDCKYAKAFFRRGTCRLGLKKLALARQDFLKVMELEPGNKFARIELDKLEEEFRRLDVPQTNPATSRQLVLEDSPVKAEIETTRADSAVKAVMTSVRQPETVPYAEKPKLEVVDTNKPQKTSSKDPQSKHKSSIFSSLPDQVKPVHKATHLKSKSSLRKISIEVRSSDEELEELTVPTSVERPTSLSLSTSGPIPGPSSSSSQAASTPALTPTVPPVPQTAYQFETDWRRLRHWPHLRTQYLKSMAPVSLQKLYHQSMETEIFIDIIHCVEEISKGDKEMALSFMKSLTKVGRFSTTVMFLSAAETQIIKSILENVSSTANSDEFKSIRSLYGL